MNKTSKSRQRRYPFAISRVFLNVITSALATFLALMFLKENLLRVHFVISTSFVTAIVFILKIRPLIRVPVSGARNKPKKTELPDRRRSFLLLLTLMAVIVFPFLLFLSALIFEPAIWFILIASTASGIGISEILFYIYCENW